MQIHELNRPRRTDEGVLGAIGTALGHSVAKGAGYDLSKNSPTASAGILDPKQKLAAVMREPAMVKLATKYAKEWVATQTKSVPEAVATATAPVANPFTSKSTGFNANNVMKLPGMAKNVKPATAPNFAGPAGARAMDAMAKQLGGTPAITQLTVPGTATTAAQNAVPPTDPAAAEYRKKFLAFANEKIAMRDPSTYQMIGLTAVEKLPNPYNLKTELDAAKAAVVAARGKPAETEAAVKNYILTAMAGAQLVASANAVAKTPAPAYNDDDPAAAATTQGTPANVQVTPDQITGLIATAGLDQPKLSAMGSKLQKLSGNRAVSSTGDSGIDQLLRSMGYAVS